MKENSQRRETLNEKVEENEKPKNQKLGKKWCKK